MNNAVGKEAAYRVLAGSAVACMMTVCLLMAACDGSGGGIVEGAATIRGTVQGFEGETAYFVPTAPRSTLALAWAEVCEWVVRSAEAAEAGVTVRVRDTDLSTVTDETGFFVISGVPPGDRELIFERGSDRGSLGLNVPPDSSIDLGDIRVSGGRATTSKLIIEFLMNAATNGLENAFNDLISTNGTSETSGGSTNEVEEPPPPPPIPGS